MAKIGVIRGASLSLSVLTALKAQAEELGHEIVFVDSEEEANKLRGKAIEQPIIDERVTFDGVFSGKVELETEPQVQIKESRQSRRLRERQERKAARRGR